MDTERPSRTAPTVVTVLSKTTVSWLIDPDSTRSANRSRETLAMAAPSRYSTGAWFTSSAPARGSVPSFVEKEKRRNLLLTKQIAQRGEGGIRREEGYHD